MSYLRPLPHPPSFTTPPLTFCAYASLRPAASQAAGEAPCITRIYFCVVVGFQSFNDSPPSRGASDPSPRGPSSTRPARRVGHWRSFPFAWVTEGCCVGRAWRHREAAGGREKLGTSSCFSFFRRFSFRGVILNSV